MNEFRPSALNNSLEQIEPSINLSYTTEDNYNIKENDLKDFFDP